MMFCKYKSKLKHTMTCGNFIPVKNNVYIN